MSPSTHDFSTHDYLRHILDEIHYLINQTAGLSKEAFVFDETLKRAFVRSLEIIGEAARKLPQEFWSAYPDIRWQRMTGMRNRMIHEYFGIDYGIVWDVVVNKIPLLGKQIEQILATASEE
ncbi:MAG: DUF86 domain-containing protein [Deltaproteobacteria bacterium]|nr:DUF86 domain-containing protein [Deltaproteobacteria bacterium]